VASTLEREDGTTCSPQQAGGKDAVIWDGEVADHAAPLEEPGARGRRSRETPPARVAGEAAIPAVVADTTRNVGTPRAPAAGS
jgi:hypothetical protein